jgi:hypothetical protein
LSFVRNSLEVFHFGSNQFFYIVGVKTSLAPVPSEPSSIGLTFFNHYA